MDKQITISNNQAIEVIWSIDRSIEWLTKLDPDYGAKFNIRDLKQLRQIIRDQILGATND